MPSRVPLGNDQIRPAAGRLANNGFIYRIVPLGGYRNLSNSIPESLRDRFESFQTSVSSRTFHVGETPAEQGQVTVYVQWRRNGMEEDEFGIQGAGELGALDDGG